MEAKYLYCIVSSGEKASLGRIGLDEAEVYTIPVKGISAVVHSCQPEPYQTEDRKRAEAWILVHAFVIDQCTNMFGTVLPFSFDVIVCGGDQAVEEWLSRNYENLRSGLERVRDKSEYTIQIFYDYDCLAERVLIGDRQIEELKEKIAKAGKGRAYLLQRNLDLRAKDLVSSEMSRLSQEFGCKIKDLAEELKVETRAPTPPEKYRNKKLLASFSCLVKNDLVASLGQALDEINSLEGFAVRFTGPWAPFNFVKISEAP